jgi:hypothetical protein
MLFNTFIRSNTDYSKSGQCFIRSRRNLAEPANRNWFTD